MNNNEDLELRKQVAEIIGWKDIRSANGGQLLGLPPGNDISPWIVPRFECEIEEALDVVDWMIKQSAEIMLSPCCAHGETRFANVILTAQDRRIQLSESVWSDDDIWPAMSRLVCKVAVHAVDEIGLLKSAAVQEKRA